LGEEDKAAAAPSSSSSSAAIPVALGATDDVRFTSNPRADASERPADYRRTGG
jgi:hypothetical protein